MKYRFILRLFALLILAVLTAPVQAVLFDPTGTWTGNLTETEFNCSTRWTPETDTVAVTVTISNFDATTGTFTMTASGDGDTLTTTGQVTGASTATASFADVVSTGSETWPDGSVDTWTDWDSGTIVMTVTGPDTVSVDVQGSYFSEGSVTAPSGPFTYSGGCDFHDTGTLTRVTAVTATGEVAPEVAPSNTITNDVQTLNQFVSSYNNTLSSRIQSALSGFMGGRFNRVTKNGAMYEAQVGLSAGDNLDLTMLGVWGSYTYRSFDDDFYRPKYDGNRHMIMGGVDFSPADNAVLGISFGYEDADIDTDFNLGQSDSDGYTIAPYFGMVLNDTWNFDLSAGYSNIDTDQYRRLTTTSARITSDVDSERWFFSGNINGFTQRGNWLLTGRAGGLYAISKDDSFTESDGTAVANRKNKLGQVSLGGEAAYSLGEFEPYISGLYSYDLHSTQLKLTAGPQPDNDRSDFLLGLGMRYFSKDNLSLTAEYSNRLGRGDYDEESLMLNARWDF